MLTYDTISDRRSFEFLDLKTYYFDPFLYYKRQKAMLSFDNKNEPIIDIFLVVILIYNILRQKRGFLM